MRFGKGVTTYDDSFDVDCCRAIAEAKQLTQAGYPISATVIKDHRRKLNHQKGDTQ